MTGSKPELRRDVVSGGWVLVAPSRSQRPHHFERIGKQNPTPKDKCPFENPQASGNGEPLSWYSSRGLESGAVRESDWVLQVIKNKYPIAEEHKVADCPLSVETGPYRKMPGIGFHEVVIPRSHTLFLSDMTPDQAEVMVRAYQDRVLTRKTENCLEYIFIFHNHGEAAGASVWHPHSQIMALPIIPEDVMRSLDGSKKYWDIYKTCVHCNIIDWELKENIRVIFENEHFLVVAPYASRSAFESRIYPKEHQDHFEHIDASKRNAFAEALVTALKKVKSALGDPPYNFFIHTAPARDGKYSFYHWHLEIFPKTTQLAGVELGTGIEVVSMSPERAAEILRNCEIA